MGWRGSSWFGILATSLTGALFLVSIEMGPVGWLAPIAPIPLLVYALHAPRAWTVGVAGAVARAIGMGGVVYVYGRDMPLAVMVSMLALGAVVYGGVILLTRWIARAAPAPAAVFAYPLLLVLAEWPFSLVSPHGAFGAMGHALVDILPLLQVASLGGMAALSFVVALVPMMLAVVIARPSDTRAALVAGGIPLLAALAFGCARLSQDYGSHARVALIGVDAHEARAFAGERQDLEAAQAFGAQIRAVAAGKPDYIVIPEKQLGGARVATASGAEIAAAAAAAAPATVVAGFDEVLPDGARVNSAQIFTPGQPPRRYLKRRMIPGVETGYRIGPESFVDGTRGVAICKDMDFPVMIRDYGRRGVELMLVPAWDFVRDGRMHSRMALVRGVENGFAIARAATSGRLTASDRYGRVIAEAVTSRDRPVTVTADLGLRGGGTVYARIGDAFAWLCVAAALALLIWRAKISRAASNSRAASRSESGTG